MDVEIIGGYIEQLKEKFISSFMACYESTLCKKTTYLTLYWIEKSNLLILGSELSSLDGQQSYQPLLYQ
jgi:hypothetical protein